MLFAIAVVLMIFLAVLAIIIVYGIFSIIMFSIFALFFTAPLWLTVLWVMFLFGSASFLMLGTIGIPLAYFLP